MKKTEHILIWTIMNYLTCKSLIMSVSFSFLMLQAGCQAESPSIQAFEEKNGKIVVEIEHYARSYSSLDVKGAKWVKGTSLTGFSGDGYMEPTEGDRGPYDTTNTWMEFDIYINTKGDYKIWWRGQCEDFMTNSFYWKIDDMPVNYIDYEITNQWHWTAKPEEHPEKGEENLVKVTLAQGLHVLKISRREPNMKLDQFVMTNRSRFIPKDTQTFQESSRKAFIRTKK
jgi:hypothetical protein